MSLRDAKMVRREDHFGLLDMLLVVAESWRLLVAVPLVVALATLAVTAMLPRAESHRASVVLLLSTDAAQTLQSASYIKAVIGEEPIADPNSQAEDWRKVVSSVSVNKLPGNNLYEVSISSPSEAVAVRILKLIVDGTSSSAFVDNSRVALEESIEATSRRLKELKEAVGTLRGTIDGMPSSETPVADANAYAQAIDILSNAIMASQVSLGADTRALAAWPIPEIVKGPTVTSSSSSPRVTVMFAGLVSGFVVLLFVFVRDGLRRAGESAESRAKLQRIKRAFGIGRNSEIGPE